MKKILSVIALVMIVAFSSGGASAQSLSDLLKGLGGQTTTSGGSDSKGKDISSMLTGVASALGIGNSQASMEQLSGTWTYAGPAVSFKSDNFLMKAGGAAAATSLEEKIEPYYRTAGLTSLVLTINNDSTFTFKGKRATLSGTIEHDSEAGTFHFKFKAFKKVNIGSMEAYVKLTGNNMELTFDVTKLMTLMQRISALSSNNAIKGASALLEQYDGMTAGFDLKKTGEAESLQRKD